MLAELLSSPAIRLPWQINASGQFDGHRSAQVARQSGFRAIATAVHDSQGASYYDTAVAATRSLAMDMTESAIGDSQVHGRTVEQVEQRVR